MLADTHVRKSWLLSLFLHLKRVKLSSEDILRKIVGFQGWLGSECNEREGDRNFSS